MVFVLNRHSTAGFNSLLPQDGENYNRLIGDLTRYVSPEHARLFAYPDYTKDMVRWSCEGQDALSWKQLTTAQQDQSLTFIRSILSDIEYSAQRYPNSFFARYFSAYRQIPSQDHIYLVDGHPVLTDWGYSGLNGSYDPLAGFVGGQRNKGSFFTLHGFLG